MRALFLLTALLAAACGGGSFLPLPPEIGWVAWVELDQNGEVASASPLIPAEEASGVWAVGDRPVVFVGFERQAFAELLSVPGASEWRSHALRNPGECDSALVSSWYDSADDSLLPPPLSAEWTEGLCGLPGLSTPACAVCTGACRLDVEEHTLAFGEDVPTQVMARGLVWIEQDAKLMAVLQSRDPALPDHVAVIDLTSGPTVSVVAHDGITETIAFDGSSAIVGNERGEVLRLRDDGTVETRIRAASSTSAPLLVAAALGSDIFAFEYGATALQIEGRDATDSELGRPIVDMSASSVEVGVLRGYDFVSLLVLSVPVEFTIPLWEAIEPADYDVASRPRVGIVRDAPHVAVRNRPVHWLTDAGEWNPIGWPAENAQARAFAALAGGTLIGGERGIGTPSAVLYFERSEIACETVIEAETVGVLVSSSGEDVAYALTEGPVRPRLLEIRVR